MSEFEVSKSKWHHNLQYSQWDATGVWHNHGHGSSYGLRLPGAAMLNPEARLLITAANEQPFIELAAPGFLPTPPASLLL